MNPLQECRIHLTAIVINGINGIARIVVIVEIHDSHYFRCDRLQKIRNLLLLQDMILVPIKHELSDVNIYAFVLRNDFADLLLSDSKISGNLIGSVGKEMQTIPAVFQTENRIILPLLFRSCYGSGRRCVCGSRSGCGGSCISGSRSVCRGSYIPGSHSICGGSCIPGSRAYSTGRLHSVRSRFFCCSGGKLLHGETVSLPIPEMLFLLSGFAPVLPLLLFTPAFLLCRQAFPVGGRIFRRKYNLLDRQNIRHKLAETKPCPLAHFFILFHLALRESCNQKLHALLIHGKHRIIENILIRIILQIVMKFIRKIDLQLRRCHLWKLHPANIICL